MANPAKLIFIEILRVFAILVIVLGHTPGLTITGLEETSLYLVISPLVRVVVPAFFVISGPVLGVHHTILRFLNPQLRHHVVALLNSHVNA